MAAIPTASVALVTPGVMVHPARIHKQVSFLQRAPFSHHHRQSIAFSRWRPFCVKAMEVSGPGSVDSVLVTSIQEKLKEELKTEDVLVKDAYGDGRHVSIEVISSEFEGKSSVNRQRMVYKAIWEELQTTVHAVDSMRTWTPAEAAQEKPKQAK